MNKTFYTLPLALSAIACLASLPAYSMQPPDAAPQVSQTQLVAADATEGAKNFIQSMAQRGIDFLGNDSLSAAQRKGEFRTLLRSSYDLPTIGRFALGTYWKTASPKQQAEYQKLFENMIVDVYSRRFGDYKGQDLVVKSARKESDTDIFVTSQIIDANKGGEPIQVDWRVRNKGAGYKVIDVVVAGVSMALTQRSDFASVIQRGGGDINILLDHLRNGKATKEAAAQ